MNSPVAALIVVSILFATTWSRDGHRPDVDRRLASRGHIESTVLASAREAARETSYVADSVQNVVETTDVTGDACAPLAMRDRPRAIDGVVNALQSASVPSQAATRPAKAIMASAMDGVARWGDRIGTACERAATTVWNVVVRR